MIELKRKSLIYFMSLALTALLVSCGDDDDDDNDDNDDTGGATLTVNIGADQTSIEEGEMVTITVTLSAVNSTGSAIRINLNASGTAQPGTDISDIPDNVMIADGERESSFSVTAQQDAESEGDETFGVSISDTNLPPDVSVGSDALVTVTITDGVMLISEADCPNDNSTDQNNFQCTDTPSATSMYSESVSGDVRTIMGNGIPTHNFRNQIPNMVMSLNSDVQTYTVDATPSLASNTTSITSNGSPAWAFGIALNGVKIDPAPAQPFIFTNTDTGEENLDWVFEPNNNMEAVGLDCAIAHVQPDGQYHYHGNMGVYADQLQSGISTATSAPSSPTLIGWAGDGFPIVYRFGPGADGNMKLLTSSYQLRSGLRTGDGVSAPCGEYTGRYTNDYEFVSGSGDLDECNGIAQNITIGSATFSYFYVITDAFPIISRCFSGTPDNTFRLGPP